MAPSRELICKNTATKLAAALPRLGEVRAVVGLDAFVDEIIAVVEKRQGPDQYQPVPTIARLAEKIAAAAGQSANYELVVKHIKLGGNGPIMANALARLGMGVTYIGNLGDQAIHPVFESFAARAEVISIAEPAHTDALEFADGKLMLGKLAPLNEITWPRLLERVGLDRLRETVAAARLVALTNWTMIPHMTVIWRHLRQDVLATIAGPRKMLFVDLSDPEKRTRHDLLAALTELSEMESVADVVLGLNLKESQQVLAALGLEVPAADAESRITQTAAQIRARLRINCVVVHPRAAAAAATQDAVAEIAGPFVGDPKISTGAGDHFNAGFTLGRVLGFDLPESLCAGVAASGYYVRTAESPDGADLAKFIAQLPPPQM